MVRTDDERFTVPRYTLAGAARALGVPTSTFATWAWGHRRMPPSRQPVIGEPIVTAVRDDDGRPPGPGPAPRRRPPPDDPRRALRSPRRPGGRRQHLVREGGQAGMGGADEGRADPPQPSGALCRGAARGVLLLPDPAGPDGRGDGGALPAQPR